MNDEQPTNGDNGNGNKSRLDQIEELLQQFIAQSMRNEFNLAQYRKASDERLSAIEASQVRTQAMLENLSHIVSGIGDNTIALEKFRDRVAEAAKVQPGDYSNE